MKKIFLIFIFVFLFNVSGVLAEGLVIYDKEQEINLVPSGAGHLSVHVKNETGSNLDIQTVIKSFRFNDDGKEIELFDDENNILVNSWLKSLKSSNFKLEPGEEGKATFLVTVPYIVDSRGYYAAIYFVGKNNNGETFRSDDSLVLLGVEEKASNVLLRGGEIRSLMVPERVYYGPVDFGIEFENTGKIHYKTKGEIEIFNILNKKVKSIPIEEKNILPGSRISLSPGWDRKYLIGKYLIVAKTINGDGEESVLTGQFWAFPWREVSAIFVVTLLVLVARKLRNKKPIFE
jgi:hypothetical protein